MPVYQQRLQQHPCLTEWILMPQRYVGFNRAAHTHTPTPTLHGHVVVVYPCIQQGCHGYTQTHPPSHKRGDAERFRGAGAEALPSSSPNSQPPFSTPSPRMNLCPLFSMKTSSTLKRLSSCQLRRPGSSFCMCVSFCSVAAFLVVNLKGL